MATRSPRCINCGTPLGPGVTECPTCGTEVDSGPVTAEVVDEPTAPGATATSDVPPTEAVPAVERTQMAPSVLV